MQDQEKAEKAKRDAYYRENPEEHKKMLEQQRLAEEASRRLNEEAEKIR